MLPYLEVFAKGTIFDESVINLFACMGFALLMNPPTIDV